MMSGASASSLARTVGSQYTQSPTFSLGGIVAQRTHSSDGPRSGYCGKFERVGTLSAEHLARVGENAVGEYVDDDFARAEQGRIDLPDLQ